MIKKCHNQLQERKQRRMDSGLPIYVHSNTTFEDHLESSSKFSKFDAYDKNKHMLLIQKLEKKAKPKQKKKPNYI